MYILDALSESKVLTNSGESDSHLCLLANLTEDVSLAVLGDVMCHFKVTKSTCRKVKGREERSELFVG